LNSPPCTWIDRGLRAEVCRKSLIVIADGLLITSSQSQCEFSQRLKGKSVNHFAGWIRASNDERIFAQNRLDPDQEVGITVTGDHNASIGRFKPVS
jgi:hypothetical protein